jgi:hypothetical protein
MSKILSKAERVAALRELPEIMIPSTLKYKTFLPNINKITILYRKDVK